MDSEDAATSAASGARMPINGAYLTDCAPTEPSVTSAVDAAGTLRVALWEATQAQLDAALAERASKK